MYSPRQKISHYRALQSIQHADKDLELLSAKVKLSDSKLRVYKLSPARYAKEILYALLDVATVEQIKENRKPKNSELKNEVDELKYEVDELKNENEELKEKVEELEQEKASEPEVKKQAPKKTTEKKSSKSTKSIPKSTGKISMTKTSK